MLRLWGRLSSVNVQKAVWALDEAGLAYERVEAGGAHGVVGEPAYRRLNPNGLVPTLEEDGFVLWESNAILRYLGRRGGTLALPEDPRACALVDQWLDWQATSFTPAMRDAFWQLFRVPPAERDPAAIERSLARTEPLAAILDAALAGRDFVVGERFSIADIALACAAHRWLNLPAARAERPAMARWLAGLARRPGSARALGEPIG